MFRKLLLTFLGIVIALEFFVSTSNTQAQSPGNVIPGSQCEFQPPTASRTPTQNSIRIDNMIRGGNNISPDVTYPGLHRWSNGQWPGVDYLVPTTVAFKNGGTIRKLGWDNSGGGYSVYIDGEGDCSGWMIFIGHLNYNPATRYQTGQHVGPDEIIGEPGCSGFENNCADKGSKIPPHNHYTLGYTKNIFDLSDGTVIDYVGGHYWINPTRVEGIVASADPVHVTTTPTLPPSLSLDFDSEGFMDTTNGPLIEEVVWTPQKLPFKMPLWSYPVLTFSICVLIFARNYRSLGFAGTAITLLFLFAFYHITPVYAEAPNQAYTISDDFSFDLADPPAPTPSPEPPPTAIASASEDGKPSKNPMDYPLNQSTPCEVNSSYSQSVLQWCGLITYYAKLNNIDPNMFAAMITQESGGNPEACDRNGHQVINGINICGSASGAIGLGQVMPRDGLSASFKNDAGVPYFSNRPSALELLNPEINLATSSKMLSNLGLATNPREALKNYGPSPKWLIKKYGDPYYYADIVLNIYNSHK